MMARVDGYVFIKKYDKEKSRNFIEVLVCRRHTLNIIKLSEALSHRDIRNGYELVNR